MTKKILVAIDWENVNLGNKANWDFLQEYPKKNLTVFLFHQDLSKAKPPIIPNVPITYLPTPSEERETKGQKNSTDRFMIKTILQEVFEQNTYENVILVSDDKGFETLLLLLKENFLIHTEQKRSDINNLKELNITQNILTLLKEKPIGVKRLPIVYQQIYQNKLSEQLALESRLSLKEFFAMLEESNILYKDTKENTYALLVKRIQNPQHKNDVFEDITNYIKGHTTQGDTFTRSVLFSFIRKNTQFIAHLNSKKSKQDLIIHLKNKKVVQEIGTDVYQIL